MADIFSKRKRSRIMSRIRSAGTAPEIKLYEIVRATLGGRRRIDRNCANLPGRPDIIVPSLRLAIFADGCFYHGCPEHGHDPKSNMDYWLPKLARNRERDKKAVKALNAMGFRVWRVWECALKGKKLARTARSLAHRLERQTRILADTGEIAQRPRFAS